MQTVIFDNPVWQSLSGTQSRFSVGTDRLKRYPADITPFIAVPEAGQSLPLEMDDLVTADESVCFVGQLPSLRAPWVDAGRGEIFQMRCPERIPVVGAEPSFRDLTPKDASDMLELTSIAFPGFFRSRTHELGRYIGIFIEGRLAAMTGERMQPPGHVEVSGVCTHPDYVGKGYAGRLITEVTNTRLEEGKGIILHVGVENTRAIDVYKRLGFVTTLKLPILYVRRS